MRIGIDFDEVLANSIETILQLHNLYYGTALSKKDATSYHFRDVWGGTEEEAIKKVDAFFEKHHVMVCPMPGAIEGIKALKKDGHELYIVTGRSGDDVAHTEEWLAEHFPDVFAGVHYGNFFTLNKKHELRKKAEICKELGIAILVDDDMHTVEECAAAGIRVFLFDQPWNQGEIPAGVTRVHSWEELIKNVK